MGLSKSSRLRNTARQAEPLNPSLAYALEFLKAQHAPTAVALRVSRQAVQLGLWLEGMQKQLQFTARSLRDHPASVLSSFQKILSRPSYIFAPAGTNDWMVLLGPRMKRAVTAHELTRAKPLPSYNFVVPQPAFLISCLRAVYQWLMHPVIDTRESSDPAIRVP